MRKWSGAMTNTPTISLLTLLSMFSPFSDAELRQKPSSPAIRGVIERLPSTQSTYETIAVELAAAPLDSEEAAERFERTSMILRLLLYDDGRSELALYRLVDAAVASRRTEELAISPLAALANYYHSGGRPGAPTPILHERLIKYARIKSLFNNAMACQRNLQRRSAAR